MRFFSSLFAIPATGRTVCRPAVRQTRLQVEALDGRVLPSAMPVFAGALDLLGKVQPADAATMTKSPGPEKTGPKPHHQGHESFAVPLKQHGHSKLHKKKHRSSSTSLAATSLVVVPPPVTPATPPGLTPNTPVPVQQASRTELAAVPSPGQAEVSTKGGPGGPPTYTLQFEEPRNGAKSLAETINVSSFQFGATNPTTVSPATNGSRGVGAKFNDLDVTMPLGDYSPLLFQALTTGGHYGMVTLTEWATDLHGIRSAVATWTMYEVFVKSDQIQGASNGANPVEEVHFAYGAIQESVGKNVAIWNVLTNNDTLNDLH
jgi:type VI protein secretion system component Hcp